MMGLAERGVEPGVVDGVALLRSRMTLLFERSVRLAKVRLS